MSPTIYLSCLLSWGIYIFYSKRQLIQCIDKLLDKSKQLLPSIIPETSHNRPHKRYIG